MTVITRIRRWSERGSLAYSEEPTPLLGYALLLGLYSLVFGSLLSAGVRRRRLRRRVRLGDVLLLGVATHKLTRIVTKDWVTAPLRAPFVRYESSNGGGEVTESARGKGLQKAIGDLLTCPFCFGPWIAGALVAGLTVKPRATRTIAGTFVVVALSDFLHHAYAVVKKSSSWARRFQASS